MTTPDKKQAYHWQVKWLPLASLKDNPDNPRLHSEKDLLALQESIRKYGPIWPILVNNFDDLLLVAGHGRKAAAIAEGYEEWPVIDAAHLSAEEVDEFMAVDNKVQELSFWDEKKLAEGFARRGGKEIAGFTISDIQQLEAKRWADHEEKPEVIPPLAEKAKSSPGELYILGRHRLLVGDCTSSGSWKRLMLDKEMDILFTDPPYGVNYDPANAAEGRKIQNDDLNDDELKRMWKNAFTWACQNAKKGAPYYACSPQGGTRMMMLMEMILEAGWLLKHELVWVKDQFVMGRADYHYRHESMLYGWKDGQAHPWHGARTQDSVWEIPRPKRSEAKITLP